jgi:hypothetical protein
MRVSATALLAAVAFLFVLATPGCKSSRHTSDPQLRQIDDLINNQLPPGTPQARVAQFLNNRGYALEPSPDPRTIITTIEHVDLTTLQPSAARITFHFDKNDKLATYDMMAVPPSGPH